jgi:hypothetical protein
LQAQFVQFAREVGRWPRRETTRGRGRGAYNSVGRAWTNYGRGLEEGGRAWTNNGRGPEEGGRFGRRWDFRGPEENHDRGVWGRNPDDYDDPVPQDGYDQQFDGNNDPEDVDQDAVPKPVPQDGYNQQFNGNNDPENVNQDAAVLELDQQDGDAEDALVNAAWGDITSFKQLVMALDHRFRKLEQKIDRLDRKVSHQGQIVLKEMVGVRQLQERANTTSDLTGRLVRDLSFGYSPQLVGAYLPVEHLEGFTKLEDALITVRKLPRQMVSKNFIQYNEQKFPFLKFQINCLISLNGKFSNGTKFGQFIAKWIILEKFYRRKFY